MHNSLASSLTEGSAPSEERRGGEQALERPVALRHAADALEVAETEAEGEAADRAVGEQPQQARLPIPREAVREVGEQRLARHLFPLVHPGLHGCHGGDDVARRQLPWRGGGLTGLESQATEEARREEADLDPRANLLEPGRGVCVEGGV